MPSYRPCRKTGGASVVSGLQLGRGLEWQSPRGGGGSRCVTEAMALGHRACACAVKSKTSLRTGGGDTHGHDSLELRFAPDRVGDVPIQVFALV